MEPKVTFLFGAGASRQAIPIVSEIPESLKTFRNHLIGCKVDAKYDKARGALTKDLDWLIERLTDDENPTIDTLARRLWHDSRTDPNAERNYWNLKTCLSLFFLFTEKATKVDRRYTDFYLKVLTHGYQFPSNVKILTWNYDSQLETAYAKLAKLPRIESARDKLGVLSKHIFPRLESGTAAWMPTADGINIYKLNGTASVFHIPTGRAVDNYVFNEVFEDICDKYIGCQSKHSSAISFCWDDEENGPAHRGVVDLAIEAVRDTRVLVVIGYSVPWYNKPVDHRIFSSMKNLSRILIQDPAASTVKEKLSSLVQCTDIRCNTSTEEFDLPVELLGI